MTTTYFDDSTFEFHPIDPHDHGQVMWVAAWLQHFTAALAGTLPAYDNSPGSYPHSPDTLRQHIEREERKRARDLELIETAAKAICDEETPATDHVVHWDELAEQGKEIYRRTARAALIAAGVVKETSR